MGGLARRWRVGFALGPVVQDGKVFGDIGGHLTTGEDAVILSAVSQSSLVAFE